MEIELSIEEEGSGRKSESAVQVEDGSAVKDVLEAADINPETVLVENGGKILPTDKELEDDAELRVLKVISGG